MTAAASDPAGSPAELLGAQSPPTPSEPVRGDACPLCGSPLAAEQGWCLRCGAAARTRLAAPPNWKAPIAVAAVVVVLALGVLAAALVKLAGNSPAVPAITTTVVTAAASPAVTTAAAAPATAAAPTGSTAASPPAGASSTAPAAGATVTAPARGATTAAPAGGTTVPAPTSNQRALERLRELARRNGATSPATR